MKRVPGANAGEGAIHDRAPGTLLWQLKGGFQTWSRIEWRIEIPRGEGGQQKQKIAEKTARPGIN